jgi:PAS domain S-box-containing protein
MSAQPDRRAGQSSAAAGSDTSDGHAGPTIWTVFALLGVLLVAYLAFLIWRRSWQFSPWLDGWVVVAFEFIASFLCIAGAIGRPRRRRVALLLGTACLSWSIGDLVLTIESLGGATPPTPSLADVFYLGFFPSALVAIAFFIRGEIGRGIAANWLDGAIAALGTGALCAGFAFHALDHLVRGPFATVATNMAYPVCDLLLLGLVAGSAVVVAGRIRATLVLIAIGMAINAVGDTFNFAAVQGGISNLGNIMNAIAWPASILLCAMAMWVGDRGGNRFARQSASGFLVPGMATISSLAILVIDNVYQFGAISVGLATITVLLAGVRLAFRPALRLAREQLRSSEQRSNLLFGQNPQPMAAYDRQTLEILEVSDLLIAKYGYSREEFRAMTIKDLVPREDIPLLLAYLDAHPDGGRPGLPTEASSYPGRHVMKDGSRIDIEITSNNVDLDGRACRIALYHDVTARNQAASELAIARDAAVEASNMKSAFLANVSHEIRTPMNGVIGMTELLLETPLNDEQRGFAQQVSRSGEQMLVLINDILDISKLETGHVEIDIAAFDLHETIEQTCAVAGVQAVARGLHFEVQIAEDVPRRMRGDSRRLQQVLLNLVSNAVKFTAEGAVTVSVSATPQPPASAGIRVEVADSGVGIDPAGLARMFEAFTQADASTTRNYGGTGLGLAIARELVELMGGAIRAESELGHGSTFSFELGMELDLESTEALAGNGRPASAREASSGALLSWRSAPLLLVADDSPVNQIVAARALERCGCNAQLVDGGRAALRALASQRYDAVLMDCQMPDMDGYEATAELRRRELGVRHTPVIAITAHAMEGDRKRCLDAGMDDYVSKPMRHADLVEVLLRWIPSQDEAIRQTA